MELTANQRTALLMELDTAQNDRDVKKNLVEMSTEKEEREWFEIGHHLALERIKTIKEAITSNQIDY